MILHRPTDNKMCLYFHLSLSFKCFVHSNLLNRSYYSQMFSVTFYYRPTHTSNSLTGFYTNSYLYYKLIQRPAQHVLKVKRAEEH